MTWLLRLTDTLSRLRWERSRYIGTLSDGLLTSHHVWITAHGRRWLLEVFQ